MKRFLLLIMTVMLVFMTPVQTLASDAEHGEKTVKVGWYLTPDYMEMTEDGVPGGYYYDYLQTLSYYTGWKCEYVPGTWSECLEKLKNGEIDLLCSVHKTNEREKAMDFSAVEILTESCKLYVTDNDRYDFEDYKSFEGMRIAVAEDSYEQKALKIYAQTNNFTYNEVVCDSYAGAFQAVDSGLADGMVSATFDNHEGYYVVGQFASSPVYFGVHKGKNNLLGELNYGMSCISMYYPTFQTVLYNKHISGYSKQHVSLTPKERAYIQDIGSITMACGTSWYPYEYYDENQEFTGASVEIMRQIAEITGLKVNFVEDTGFSMSNFREAGEKNLVTSMSWDSAWASDSNVAQTQPFFDAEVLKITSDLTTECKTVALLDGGYIYRNVAADYPELSVIFCDSTRACIQAVADGKADCTFLNEHEASYYLELSRFHRLSSRRISKFTQGICFGVSASSDPMLVEILSKALTYMDEEEKEQLIADDTTVPDEFMLLRLFYDYPVVIVVMSIISMIVMFFVLFLVYRSRAEKKRRMAVEKANHAKTDFLSRMSHDMRTPMNGILGLVTLMQDQEMSKELHDSLLQIQISGKYLLNLINDTLDMNKIEMNRLELHPSITDSEKLIENIQNNAQMLADDKGVTFEIRNINKGQVTHTLLNMDMARTEQIFMNLISNAIKFTKEGGSVLLLWERLETTDAYIRNRYVVKDDGIGMSPEFLKHIYEPFSQENRENTDRESGTGLGMSIVYQLVELMGGHIQVESELNAGTAFTIELQFERYMGEEAVVAKKEPVVTQVEGMRVLLCEDHPLNRKIACGLLEKKGILTETAENGEEGLKKFVVSDEGYYNLILMDIRMPVMNGYETTIAIRKSSHADAKRIPIVAMTANAFDDDIQKCQEAGMNAHIAKPIDVDRLYEVIAELALS